MAQRRRLTPISGSTLQFQAEAAAQPVASTGASVDATAVGITLALFSDNIPVTLSAIGLVTFMMCFAGLRLGCVIVHRTGKWAELAGGIGLIGIGTSIRFTHLSQ